MHRFNAGEQQWRRKYFWANLAEVEEGNPIEQLSFVNIRKLLFRSESFFPPFSQGEVLVSSKVCDRQAVQIKHWFKGAETGWSWVEVCVCLPSISQKMVHYQPISRLLCLIWAVLEITASLGRSWNDRKAGLYPDAILVAMMTRPVWRHCWFSDFLDGSRSWLITWVQSFWRV